MKKKKQKYRFGSKELDDEFYKIMDKFDQMIKIMEVEIALDRNLLWTSKQEGENIVLTYRGNK